jgi:hypothetical protein
VNKIWYGPTTDGTVPSPQSDNGQGPLGALGPNQLWFGPARGARLAGHFIWDGVAGEFPHPIGADTLALALGDPTLALPSFMNAGGNGQNGWQTLDYAAFTEAFATAHEKLAPTIETAEPDLSAFAARGGTARALARHERLADHAARHRALLRSRGSTGRRIRDHAAVCALLSGARFRPLLRGGRAWYQTRPRPVPWAIPVPG